MAPAPSALPQVVEDQGKLKSAKYARFFWPILRGITLIVALSALIPFLSELLYNSFSPVGFSVFVLATYALIWMNPPPKTLPAIEGEATKKVRQLRLPWSLIAYTFFTGLGCNWVCVFLWFSRRYAFFSAPVIGVTGLILALYAAIGLLLARLANWRIALAVFFVLLALSSIVLRLGLLR